MMVSFGFINRNINAISFCLGLPTLLATYYQSWRARQEAREVREGLVLSEHCLEFVLDDGELVNVVPLETLHSLPAPTDIVLLPGRGLQDAAPLGYGAYRILSVEHIFTKVERKGALPFQARLAKAVAHVEHVSTPSVLLPTTAASAA